MTSRSRTAKFFRDARRRLRSSVGSGTINRTTAPAHRGAGGERQVISIAALPLASVSWTTLPYVDAGMSPKSGNTMGNFV